MRFFEEFRELSEQTCFRGARDLKVSQIEFSNPVCGDRFWVELSLEGPILDSARYWCEGCWPVQGCAELLFERYQGKPWSALRELKFEDFSNMVEGVPVSKRHAFSLVYRAVQSSLAEKVSEPIGKGPPERLY